MVQRRITKPVKIGRITLSSHDKIAIQSMLSTDFEDVKACVEQTLALEAAGCDIVRLAIPTSKSVRTIYEIKKNTSIPLVADIHFDHKLALEACEAGIDKVRINPGNIGTVEDVRSVAVLCGMKNIPIRIGVNAGSLPRSLIEKHGGPTPEALVESAFSHVELLNRFDFDNIVLSLKASNIKTAVDAYRLIAQQCRYPLHIGITEAGTEDIGTIKSAIGIGSLLLDGIGDTLRVSLTADPIKEIMAAKRIFKSLSMKGYGPEIISCPTCGRTKINLVELAEKVEKRLEHCEKNIKIAVMGCAVNGPGEAVEADIGIAGGSGEALLFKKGKILRKIPENEILDQLLDEIANL